VTSFSRAFGGKFGVSPREYRRPLRMRPALAQAFDRRVAGVQIPESPAGIRISGRGMNVRENSWKGHSRPLEGLAVDPGPGVNPLPSGQSRLMRFRGICPPESGRESLLVSNRNAHGHQNVEKRSLDLDYAGAHFIDQFQENLVIRKIFKWIHEELRIEGD